jgi:hypothetical protein
MAREANAGRAQRHLWRAFWATNCYKREKSSFLKSGSAKTLTTRSTGFFHKPNAATVWSSLKATLQRRRLTRYASHIPVASHHGPPNEDLLHIEVVLAFRVGDVEACTVVRLPHEPVRGAVLPGPAAVRFLPSHVLLDGGAQEHC